MMPKRLLILIVFISFVFSLTACSNNTENSGETSQAKANVMYQKISAEDAKLRMDSGDNLIVVDVRTQSEYNEKHIEGAILIPNEEITTVMPQELPNLDDEILLYCRSGNRSKQAAEKLIAIGYTNVWDFGGIIDWPYDTVSEK